MSTNTSNNSSRMIGRALPKWRDTAAHLRSHFVQVVAGSHNRSDAVSAQKSALAARHSELAGQVPALIEPTEGSIVLAVADEVQGHDVSAKTVQLAQRKLTLAAADTAAALTL